MKERRLFARIKIRIPLKFLIPANGKEGKAETVDISANGIGLITKESLELNTPLEMWLALPDHHDPLHVAGQVVWSQSLGDNTQKRVGIHMGKERFIELGRAWLHKETNPDKI